MFQSEVAERLTAKPGTKAYGFLTVVAQRAARVSVLFRIPPDAFRPRPRVVALLRFEMREVEKLNRIDDFRLRHGATWAELVIYTDHNSDLALLMRAGQGFAVNPSRAFAQECQRHCLPVLRWS